jgi:hypothetical protein
MRKKLFAVAFEMFTKHTATLIHRPIGLIQSDLDADSVVI